jgi:hypothetical protein
MKRLLLTNIAALFLATGTAHASSEFCAVVLKTSDGFLALRDGPGTQYKMIAKLEQGDFLYADTSLGPQKIGKRKWVHIVGVPRLDFKDGYEPEEAIHGWVYQRYIQDFACRTVIDKGEALICGIEQGSCRTYKEPNQ